MALTVTATAISRVVAQDTFQFINDTGGAISSGQKGVLGSTGVAVNFDRDIASGALGTARFDSCRTVFEGPITAGTAIAVGDQLTITAGKLVAGSGLYVALPSWDGATYGGANAANGAATTTATTVRYTTID